MCVRMNSIDLFLIIECARMREIENVRERERETARMLMKSREESRRKSSQCKSNDKKKNNHIINIFCLIDRFEADRSKQHEIIACNILIFNAIFPLSFNNINLFFSLLLIP